MTRPSFEPDDLAPWIEISFDPAQGPGGQHVNRAHTRATLSFDLEGCTLLPDRVKDRLRREERRRLAKDGRLRLVGQEHRDQKQNRRAVLERLCELLAAASVFPKNRKATRPTRGSQRRRLDAKRRRGDTKQARRRPSGDDG